MKSPPFGVRSAPPPQFRTSAEPKLEKIFSENTILYFPADRFEPPDWLNKEHIEEGLIFPEPVMTKGLTARKIFKRSLLKSSLDWLQSILLDLFIANREMVKIPGPNDTVLDAYYFKPGRNFAVYQAVLNVLGNILGAQPAHLSLDINSRHSRRFTVIIERPGEAKTVIPNLLSLSAGQSALFALFCNIIRDFELTGAKFDGTQDVRGIVLIDETDLHLHVGFQHDLLPQLMQMFPKVQFILTAHSPIFIMGMQSAYGEDGFKLIEMPSGKNISPEVFSEFQQAFSVFEKSTTFHQKLGSKIKESNKPLLLVEGKTDRIHLEAAWSKLNPNREMPFSLMPCSDSDNNGNETGGGVKTLKLMLEVAPKLHGAKVIGLFDNDRAGAEQFYGLTSQKGYQNGTKDFHRVHANGYIHVIILPIPSNRIEYVIEKVQFKVFQLEHYYSNETLRRNNMIEDGLFGSQIFPISDSNSVKVRFAELATNFSKEEFNNFAELFSVLESLSFPS